MNIKQRSIPFAAAGLPKHSFPSSWAQHLHLAATTAGTHILTFSCQAKVLKRGCECGGIEGVRT